MLETLFYLSSFLFLLLFIYLFIWLKGHLLSRGSGGWKREINVLADWFLLVCFFPLFKP